MNNAGCMVNQRELTEEGLEKNFATNTLGRLNYIAFFLNACIYIATGNKLNGQYIITLCVKTKNKCHKHVFHFQAPTSSPWR